LSSTSKPFDYAQSLFLILSGFALVCGFLSGSARSQNTNTSGIHFESVSVVENKSGEPIAGVTDIGKGTKRAIQFKDQRFMASNLTLEELIAFAYHIKGSQLVNEPEWVRSERFNIDAKLNVAVEQVDRQVVIQSILTDHFKLFVHRDNQQSTVYALLAGEGESKLQPSSPGYGYPNGFKLPNGQPILGGILSPKTGELVGQATAISSLVNALSDRLPGRTIVDKTGLTGKYDFTLRWTSDGSATPEAALTQALQEELNLKLEPEIGSVEFLVIDHVEKPAPKAEKMK
jgi:uncharacterized protein (TIGR03435 family)